MYKEKIYQAMDSFLTESTDLKEKPIIRSVETLNKDRHLFVEKMEEIIQEVIANERERIVDEFALMQHYTGGSSVEPKDLRINLKEAINRINNYE